MDGLASDHAGDVPLRGEDFDAAAGERERVNAADGTERDQALGHHADDLESDLVVVAGEHELELRVRVQLRDRVSEHVGADGVGEGLQVFAVDFGLFELEPGGSAGHEQFFEEFQCVFVDHIIVS